MMRDGVRRRVGVCAAGGVLLTASLTGCGTTAADLPLPGGGGPAESYRIDAVFQDALNLPEQAHVKLDGVDVGAVDGISVRNYRAHVSMSISEGVELPIGTQAELRQATPLGDVFVALHTPEREVDATLRHGDVIQLGSTSAAASVEDTLAALSTLVNGGGMGNLQTIVHELNAALEGNSDELGRMVRNMNNTLSELNKRTTEIDRVIDSARSLVDTAKRQRKTVDEVLERFPAAMKVVTDRTDELVSVLRKVDAAAADVHTVLAASSDDVLAMLREVGPALDGFGNIDSLGDTLRTMIRLGRHVETIAKGHAGAGAASFSGITDIPYVDGGVLGPEDLEGGIGSVQDNLKNLIERLRGQR